jgi:hypothetical protein
MRFTCWIPEHGDTEGDSLQCTPTTALATGTPRVPAHERPTCSPWYSEHEWCATARPSPSGGPTDTQTGSAGP